MTKKVKKVMSGVLTAVTIFSSCVQPMVSHAAEMDNTGDHPPTYEAVKELLNEDEIVTAHDYEMAVGDEFDVYSDFTGLEIADGEKVNVTFETAEDSEGNAFTTAHEGTFTAVYYVEPIKTDHPTYQISRKLVVKDTSNIPDLESVKSKLSENEMVSAEDYTVTAGSNFNVESDYSGLKFNRDKVKVKLHEVKNESGQEFDIHHADTYTAVYYRTEFKRMIQDAADKKIDLILCASVSRFARNMSDCMNIVRQLKTTNPSHQVGVYFETENIYTLDPESNQSLAIHAMLADWESANKSRRMILSYDQRICTGQYPVLDLLGYRHTKEGELIIQPEEAKTVRFIFLAYIVGYGYDEIANVLTEHERPTLKGRTDWNAGMVRNIMTNERRWGDLEARKRIVIDYVEHKSKRNEEDRVSAYEEGHHEGIVTKEIATAAKYVSSSSRQLQDGVPELMVIAKGALKGFVGVCPAWSGIDYNTFLKACQEVYLIEELQQLQQEMRIWSGKEYSKVVSMQLSGYEVPYGILFLNRNMPSLTIDSNYLKFNKACYSRLENCDYIEILYHPIMQVMIVRPSDKEKLNSIKWKSDKGNTAIRISSKAFSHVLYKSFQWESGYRFRFRGICKQRGKAKLLVFSLDESQVIVKDERRKDVNNSSFYAENKRKLGLNYFIRDRKDKIIDSIQENDILETGVIVENPMIGHIPTREEILQEIEQLLMNM